MVPINLGGGAVSSSTGIPRINDKSGRFLYAQGLRYNTRGLIQAQNPWQEYGVTNFPGSNRILAGWDWWPSPGVHRVVIVSTDGLVRKDTYGAATFATTLKNYGGALNEGHMPSFVEGGKETAASNRKLFLFVKDQVVQVLSGDGAAMANIATPPADWAGANQPICGAIHEGRLWGAGNPNDPNRVYYSTTGNHEDFTGAGSGSLSIFPGEGQQIFNLVSYRGLLLVFKYPKGIYFVDTSDPTITNWKIKRVTLDAGCMTSPRAVAAVDENIVFMDSDSNIWALSASQNLGGISLQSISNAIDGVNIFADQTWGNSTNLVYRTSSRELFLSNNGGLNRLDFNGSEPRFTKHGYLEGLASQSSTCWRGIDNSSQETIFASTYGNTNGLFLVDRNNGAFPMLATNNEFQTIFTDFSDIDPTLAGRRKTGEFLDIVYTLNASTSAANTTFQITTIWYNFLNQNESANTATYTIPVTAGTGVGFLQRRRIRIAGSGLALRLRVVMPVMVGIYSISIGFGVNDERN